MVAPLSFEFVSEVTVLHPLNNRVTSFATGGGNLASSCQELCEMARVDFAIGDSDKAPQIDASLRNRTIAEALIILASQCKWEVRAEMGYQQQIVLHDPSKAERDMTTRLNASFEIEEMIDVWNRREYLNVVERANPPITDHMSALAFLAQEAGRQIDDSRTVVRIRPAS
jgi:hypothetical protein